MFSLAGGCGCVSFRGERRARSLGDDSSSCRSSEIEQEVPKKIGKRVLNSECTMKALAPFLKFWKRDDVSMTKAERSKWRLFLNLISFTVSFKVNFHRYNYSKNSSYNYDG